MNHDELYDGPERRKNMTPEEETLVAMKAQLRLLRWIAGILMGFVLMATAGLSSFVISEIRATAFADARITALEKIETTTSDAKLNRSEYQEFNSRVIEALADIKAEQIRLREQLEKHNR